jgi:hypothetical protein
MERLARAQGVGSMAVICWEDQLSALTPVAAEAHAHVLVKGPRANLPTLDAVAAARRWADGWRGGLLGACAFDLGFHAAWVREICEQLQSDAVVLVDPAAALVDPTLIDRLIAHAREHDEPGLIFSQAAPGLSGALLRRGTIDQLCTTSLHPGRMLHYLPQQPVHDPISGKGCAPVPTPVARSPHRFTLDSDRQIRRVTDAMLR